MKRLIVTASMGRSWNRHGERSVRHWVRRVGAERYVRNDPYSVEGRIVHPWHAKKFAPKRSRAWSPPTVTSISPLDPNA